MTGVGIFGLLLGLASAFFAFVQLTRVRLVVFSAAYLMHVAAAVFYYQLVKNGVADSALYYYDPFYIYEEGFGLNTAFIVYIVQSIKLWFGGTYLDYFLLFQAVGFYGLAALMRIFDEIHMELGVEQKAFSYLILFLPSLHYWTSAIGKDSLFFFALCLTMWAAMQYKRRLVALSLGMLLMLAIRPHIAVIAAGAFAVAVMVDRETRLIVKVPVFLLSLAGAVFAVASVWNTFRIDLTDVDALADMISARDALADSEDAGRTAVTGSYPVRLFSLLFRPLFFDGGGALGLIVSVENLLLIILFGMMLANLGTVMKMARTVPFVRYALVSAAVITIVLAIGYYNVGLGIRQKATMILPQIIVAFVAMLALLQVRRRGVTVQQLPAAQPGFG
jgi:hypothetical protein